MSSAKQVQWRRAQPAPIMLISGAEQYFASVATRSIRDQLREKYADLEISELNASDYRTGQLLNLASPSLFAEPRLILIDDADRCTDEFIEDGKAYLQNPAADTFVLIRHHATSVRGKALLDAIKKIKPEIIPCDAIKKESEKEDFVKGLFQDAGRKATPGAIKAMVGALGTDLRELQSAVSQIALDAPAGAIDEAMVDKFHQGRIETTGFDVADATIDGNLPVALITLRSALETGTDPVMVTSAIASSLRSLAKVSGTNRGTKSFELAGQLGMAPWQIDKARRQLQSWTPRGIASAVEAIAKADADVKGASSDPIFALEKALQTIAAARAQR